MKRRFGLISLLALMVFLLSATACFAGTLELDKSFPKDGAKGMQVENSGVKLYFNQDMVSKEYYKANKDCFTLTNSKGKALPARVLFSHREEGLILVLVDNMTLDAKATYTLNIDKNLTAVSGDKLGKDMKISFTTLDPSSAVKVNMALMGVMMLGVIFFSGSKAKRQEKKEKEEAALNEKVNPYKVAKETGKSVEDIVEEDRRFREKKRRKIERKYARDMKHSQNQEAEEAEETTGRRVKTKRYASKAGSRFVEQHRVKKAEEARKRAQAGTTRPKNKGGKGKKK